MPVTTPLSRNASPRPWPWSPSTCPAPAPCPPIATWPSVRAGRRAAAAGGVAGARPVRLAGARQPSAAPGGGPCDGIVVKARPAARRDRLAAADRAEAWARAYIPPTREAEEEANGQGE